MPRTTAEAANKTKLEFLANISHELRNQLNAIAGYVQLLDMQLAGPIVEDELFPRTDCASTELPAGRINDMLNFVKMRTGLSYAVRPVRVHPMLAGLDAVDPSATHGARTDVRVRRGGLDLNADAEKLEQILLDLHLERAEVHANGRTHHGRLEATGDRVDISVSDTGARQAGEQAARDLRAIHPAELIADPGAGRNGARSQRCAGTSHAAWAESSPQCTHLAQDLSSR